MKQSQNSTVFGEVPIFYTFNAAFSKIAMQSDCIAMVSNDDFSAVKNKVYGEESAKTPIPV